MGPKRNKTHVLVSSDEDADVPQTVEDGNTPRSSVRLRQKSKRRSFVLPSRDEIWNKIPIEDSGKRLSKLSPRKTVNNFTKVYNSYNYDDYEDTSEDDSEGFVTDSSGNDSSNEQNVKARSGRIKNFKKRIKFCSSSSSDDDGGGDGEFEQSSQGTEKEMCNSAPSDLVQIEDRKCELYKNVSPGDTSLNDCVIDESVVCNVNSSDSDEGITPIKRRKRTSTLELDSDLSDSAGGECSSQAMNDQTNLDESYVVDVNENICPPPLASNSESTACMIENQSVDGEASSNDVIDIVSSEYSESHSSEYSTDSDSDDSAVETRDRSAKFKRKKEKLFQKFKDIQKLKRNSKQSQTLSH